MRFHFCSIWQILCQIGGFGCPDLRGAILRF